MWIWFHTGDPRLPKRVLEQQSECAVSVISVWELVMLVQRGRLETGFGPIETTKEWLARYPFEILDLDVESACLRFFA